MKKKLYGAWLCLAMVPVLANQVEQADESSEEIVALCYQDSDDQAEVICQVDESPEQQDDAVVELVFDEVGDASADTFDAEQADTVIMSNTDQNQHDHDDFDEEPEYLLDSLRAIVMTTEGTELVVQSDLDRPAITGQMLTLQDKIDECAFYLDAVKQKAVATEDQIDRYLSAVQRDNNMTLEDLKMTFERSGLTFAQAREQLGRMQTVNIIMDLRVMSNVIVPRKEVLAYYEEHPLVHDAIYYLQRAVVPFMDDQDAQREQLLQSIQNGEDNGGIWWSVVFALAASDIAEDKSFIQNAAVGEILFAGAGDDGFELYRVMDKIAEKMIPIDECYPQIERILKQPLYEKLLASYKEKLFERTTVIYL